FYPDFVHTGFDFIYFDLTTRKYQPSNIRSGVRYVNILFQRNLEHSLCLYLVGINTLLHQLHKKDLPEQLECCFDGVKIEDYIKKASAIHFIFNEETSLELLKIGSLNSCSKETNSFLNFKQKSFTLHIEKNFLNHFVVKGVSSDATFYLFDLNGKILKQGILKNGSFETPTLPVVLKIHKKTFLLQ
ncbi:MAG: hypothetical protein UIH18_02650, partial [Fibrobacteraceae bacterium]|nr:hypothetical protein [Fibrobacteraceae bacterium]